MRWYLAPELHGQMSHAERDAESLVDLNRDICYTHPKLEQQLHPGQASGAHLNPAVTLAFLLLGPMFGSWLYCNLSAFVFKPQWEQQLRQSWLLATGIVKIINESPLGSPGLCRDWYQDVRPQTSEAVYQ